MAGLECTLVGCGFLGDLFYMYWNLSLSPQDSRDLVLVPQFEDLPPLTTSTLGALIPKVSERSYDVLVSSLAYVLRGMPHVAI